MPTERPRWEFEGLEDRVPFLARLEEEDRTALLSTGRGLQFATRTAVLRQDEPSSHVLLILRGWTKVTASAAGNGYEALLALRGPGDIVGESAAVSSRPRSATVTTLEPVEAVAVEQDRFAGFLRGSPGAAMQLLSLTSDRLRSGDRHRLQAAALPVRERLAVLLLDLIRAHGRRTDAGIEVRVPLSKQELAGSIGASREMVQRLLRELRDRGVVTTGRRTLVVLQPDVLRRMARG